MHKRLYPYIWAVLTFIMWQMQSCEKDFNLDSYRNPKIEDMLVVNSILNPDSVIKVSITHPYFFTDPHLHFSPVTKMDVSISCNDCEWEKLLYDEKLGIYYSNRKPTAGEILKLKVKGETQNIYANDTIPDKIDIESVHVSGEGPIHIYWDNDYRFTYKITFSDPMGIDNYYFLAVEDDARQYEFSDMGQVDYTSDYVFQVLASMINRDVQGWQPDGIFGYPFSDKGIDGQRYTLTVSEVLQNPWVSMIERLPRKVNLYSISKAYFEYMVSVLSMDYEKSAIKGNLLSLGLMEPTKIYSNIVGGTGLMGSYVVYTFRIDLLQITGGWPSKGNDN